MFYKTHILNPFFVSCYLSWKNSLKILVLNTDVDMKKFSKNRQCPSPVHIIQESCDQIQI